MDFNTNKNHQSVGNASQRYLPYPGDSKSSSVPMPSPDYPPREPAEMTIRSRSTGGIPTNENASIAAQSKENRRVNSHAPAGQETLPHRYSVPGGTLSAHAPRKSIHPPSLTPGFQPNIQSQHQNSKLNILPKPPTQNLPHSRSSLRPSDLQQFQSTPESTSPGISARRGLPLEQQTLQRPPMKAPMPPKINRKPLSAAPGFIEGPSSGNNLALNSSANFPKQLLKAGASDPMRGGFPSTDNSVSIGCGTSTVPSNKHGLVSSLKSLFGKSHSGDAPMQIPKNRQNEGIARASGRTSGDPQNVSSKTRTSVRAKDRTGSGGFDSRNPANPPPSGSHNSREYPRGLGVHHPTNPVIRNGLQSQPMESMPNSGTNLNHGHESKMFGGAKQTDARPTGSTEHNTASRPMQQRSQPHGPGNTIHNQRTRAVPNNPKHRIARNARQNPYNPSPLTRRRDLSTAGLRKIQSHPQKNFMPAHKSPIPTERRQESRLPILRDLHNKKQLPNQSRGIGESSNIGKSSKAVSGQFEITGVPPLQIPNRQPKVHPNEDHAQHQVKKPEPYYFHPYNKHGQDHQADFGIHHSQPDRHSDYSATKSPHTPDENSPEHVYMIEQEYSVEQRNDEPFEPSETFEYPNKNGSLVEPQFVEPHSGDNRDRFFQGYSYDQSCNPPGTKNKVPFEPTPYFDDVPVSPESHEPFAPHDSVENEPTITKNNENVIQSIDSFPGTREPYLSYNLQYDSYDQALFHWSQEPSLPPYLDAQPTEPGASSEDDLQSKRGGELQEEEYQRTFQFEEEPVAFSGEYNSINVENEGQLYEELEEQQEEDDIQDENISSTLGGYAEQQYVGEGSNIQIWSEETDPAYFRPESPASDEAESRTPHGYGGADGSWDPYTADGTVSEDGVDQTLDEGSYQDGNEEYPREHYQSDDEAEIEGDTVSWRAENDPEAQHSSANYDGGGYSSNNDSGSQQDLRSQEYQEESDDERGPATYEGYESQGGENGEGYYESGEDTVYDGAEYNQQGQDYYNNETGTVADEEEVPGGYQAPWTEEAARSDNEEYEAQGKQDTYYDGPQGYGYEIGVEEENCNDFQEDGVSNSEAFGYDGEIYTRDYDECGEGQDEGEEEGGEGDYEEEANYGEDGENGEYDEAEQYEEDQQYVEGAEDDGSDVDFEE